MSQSLVQLLSHTQCHNQSQPQLMLLSHTVSQSQSQLALPQPLLLQLSPLLQLSLLPQLLVSTLVLVLTLVLDSAMVLLVSDSALPASDVASRSQLPIGWLPSIFDLLNKNFELKT